MQLLYLTNKPVYPAIDGGCKAMAQMLHCLMQLDVTIEHLCLSTHKHSFQLDAYPEAIKNTISVRSITIDTRIKFGEAFRSLFSSRSFNISRFDDKTVHSELEHLLKKKQYDIVILESLYTTPYLSTIKKHSKARVYLRSHNVEFKLWEQLSSATTSIWKKWYLKKLARNLKSYEINALGKVDHIFSITDQDRTAVEKLKVKTKNTVIPVAIAQHGRQVNDQIQRIFFVGSMNWKPNYQAAEHLVNVIFPEIRKKSPEVELHIAGSYMGDLFPSNPDQGIYNHGFAEDLHQFMHENGILVLPIKTGSGVRIKFIEAMSLGIPIITTATGAMGITETNSYVQVNSDEEMVEQVLQLLPDAKKRSELGSNAWNYVSEHLSVQHVSQLIRNEFER